MHTILGEEEKNRAGQARQLLRQSETVLCHTLLHKWCQNSILTQRRKFF